MALNFVFKWRLLQVFLVRMPYDIIYCIVVVICSLGILKLTEPERWLNKTILLIMERSDRVYSDCASISISESSVNSIEGRWRERVSMNRLHGWWTIMLVIQITIFKFIFVMLDQKFSIYFNSVLKLFIHDIFY